jgi:hypothetical protein
MRKTFTLALLAGLTLGAAPTRAQTTTMPTATPSGNINATQATAPAVTDVTGGRLQAPPPPSLTLPPSVQGVPPTPAPAFPGLPNPPTSPSTPSTVGLPDAVTSQLRPAPSGQAPINVADAQNQLAGGNFYRGPIDGQFNTATRASIRAFQVSVGLPATGLLDEQTATALGLSGFAPTATTSTAANGGTVTTTTTTPQTSTTTTTVPATTTATTTPAATTTTTTPTTTSTGSGTGSVGLAATTRPFPLATQVPTTPFALSVPPPPPPFTPSPLFIQP